MTTKHTTLEAITIRAMECLLFNDATQFLEQCHTFHLGSSTWLAATPAPPCSYKSIRPKVPASVPKQSGVRSSWQLDHSAPFCVRRFMMETERYPISVRVIGVMHKEKSKVSAHGLSRDLFQILRFSCGWYNMHVSSYRCTWLPCFGRTRMILWFIELFGSSRKYT